MKIYNRIKCQYKPVKNENLTSGTCLVKVIDSSENKINMFGLKELARNRMKQGVLRDLILAEEDYLPRDEALVKAGIFLKLIRNEA